MKAPWRQSRRVVTEGAQAASFTRRTILLWGTQAGVGGLLAARMAWLSVAENKHYQVLAESNRVQLTLIPPRRGWIVDRHSLPIAINRSDFRVDLIPDRLTDADRVIAELQHLLALPPEEVVRIHDDLAKAAGYQPVPVAEKIAYERFAAVNVRLPELPGVSPSRAFARYYPAGAAVGHLTGYVGTASAVDYKRDHDPLLITPGFKIGKEGLEKVMEARLRGVPGAKRIEVTARGKLVQELTTRPDAAGGTLQLTIDAGLQDYAARRLGANSGSAVVLDVQTGDMLAMVSMPAYDPNSFSDGISQSEWKMLSENDHIPLMNKVFQGLYPPGSTVKPMNGLALLRAGVDPSERITCTGALRVGSGVFHCHKRHGHGSIDLKNAIMQSCDIYFYEMVRRVGYDAVAPFARAMGLGQKYDLPVTSQRFGTVPDSAWKLKKYKEAWTVADSLNAAIGQGYVLANPLQLAVMAGRLASGRAIQPRLLSGRKAPAAADLGVAPEHLAIVREAMFGVVNAGGTGGAARMQIPGVALAAKTGTAQVRRISAAERGSGVLKNAALPFKLRDHALLICFAPADNPKYAAAIVLEHNGHTVRNLDSPLIGRDIMTYLFDRDQAVKTLTALEDEWGGDISARMAAQSTAWRAEHEAVAPPPPTPPGDIPAAPPPDAPVNAAVAPSPDAEADQ